MKDLTPYAAYFDEVYANYADSRYGQILRLIERYDQPDLLQIFDSPQFQNLSALIEPLIEIKNYKSQIPFPREIVTTLSCMTRIRTTRVSSDNPLANHTALFVELVGIQGFQLPTASAVFHFCHPDAFPIVDRNVEAACEILLSDYPSDFIGLALPKLPAMQVKPLAKLASYRQFMDFLRRACDLQKQYSDKVDYRFVDKALMVLGVERLRDQVDKNFDNGGQPQARYAKRR